MRRSTAWALFALNAGTGISMYLGNEYSPDCEAFASRCQWEPAGSEHPPSARSLPYATRVLSASASDALSGSTFTLSASGTVTITPVNSLRAI